MSLNLKKPRLRNRHFFLIDVLIGCFTPFMALFIRLDTLSFSIDYMPGLITITILFLIVKQATFYRFGLYKSYWRYASIDEAERIIVMVLVSTLLQTIVFHIFYNYVPFVSIENLPRSLPIIDGMETFIIISLFRFSIPWIERKKRKKILQISQKNNRVLIIGAGSAGISIVKSMQNSPEGGWHPIGFIDDNTAKISRNIQGIPVLGNRYSLAKIVVREKIDKILIAMPSVSGKVIKEILDICRHTNVETITLPAINEFIVSNLPLKSIREIKIEDLLRRETIQTDLKDIELFFREKTVLITGAGGSIGSEISRQVLNSFPKQIILLGHGENSIFYIEQELNNILSQNTKFQGYRPHIITYIADIRFLSRLENVFQKFQPDAVFHAAAHKHVPLMELNPTEAITNNLQGTKNLLDMAVKYNTKHLVMISSDKAVNPTNVMGASKRVAEMLVLNTARKYQKSFVVVRFGNVLGSRGSVIPTFKTQIAAGGPVTVTHPDITRYFITIPEAVQLTLQALLISRNIVGEIFMLNMGEPVKIIDLAREMIRLSGYKSEQDIDIKFTGLRPGEKLYEEMFHQGEEHFPTESNQIFVCPQATDLIHSKLEKILSELFNAASENNNRLIVTLLQELIPGYTSNLNH